MAGLKRKARWLTLLSACLPLAASGCFKHPGMLLHQDQIDLNSSGEAANSESTLPSHESAQLCLTMAQSLERDGKEADALAYYEQARTLDPSLADRTARRLAVLYDRLDMQAKAMTEFQALLKKYPKDASLLNDIGYSYYNRGDWEKAESHLRRAVELAPNNKRAWLNLGLARAQLGQRAEALEAFEQAVSAAEAHANLAFVLAVQGLKDEAVAEYQRALEIEPALPVAREALAKLEAPSESTPGLLPLPRSISIQQASD